MAPLLHFHLHLHSCGAILVLSFLFFGLSSRVDGGRPEVASSHVISVPSLLPADVCSSLKDYNNSSLKLVHRRGPCSPFHRRQQPTQEQILNEDQSRVNWIHRRASTSSQSKVPNSLAASKIPANPGTSLGTGNYIVTIGFGTPRKTQSVIFDTGSDVTWIQCQPCVSSCYEQKDAIFDPTQSSTYRNISCSSAYCSALRISGCSGSTCLYAVRYGDNSTTVGFFAQDTLTVSPINIIQNFRFGCGEKNSGLFGQADGLLGLGRNPVSLVQQAFQKYGGVFSYCLPSTSSSTGYLRFGGTVRGSNLQITPMLSDSRSPSFYFLGLTGLSVGGKQLSIPSTLFSDARTIIDSGTVISRFPPTVYSAMKSEFKQSMSEYPTAAPLSILDTCYDFSGYNTVTIPTVALKSSGGATINLDFSGILYVVSTSQACLAFAANRDDSDLVILGNVQQRTFNVVYDLSKETIGFGAGGCS